MPRSFAEDEERRPGEKNGDDKSDDDGDATLSQGDVTAEGVTDATVAFRCYGDEDEDGGDEEEVA